MNPSSPYINVTLAARAIRRPIIDEQRKVACIALANQTCAFINMHKLRLGYPITQWLYYSPILSAHIVEQPVFDLYNHHTLCQLRGSRVVILNTDNGNLMYDTGPLPYWPTCPLQVDCYNKVAKGFYRDAVNYYEMHLNMYPMVFGGSPVLTWIALGAQPIGYPYFDSMDGFEFVQQPSRIYWQSLANLALSGTVPLPAAAIGNMLMCRVNKYGLVALQGGGLFWMNLHRITNGDLSPNAFHVISIPGGQPGPEGVFDVTGHRAVWALNDGRWVVINMVTGTLMYTSSAATTPLFRRQLYVHPFAHEVNYLSQDGFGNPVDVTINLGPTTWTPPQSPLIRVEPLPFQPRELDFAPPIQPLPIEIVQLSLQSGSASGSVDYEVRTEAGNIVQAVNQTRMNTLLQMGPSEGTADEGPLSAAEGSTINTPANGLAEVSVIADNNDVICFTVFDAEGDVAPGPTCVSAVTTGVPNDGGVDRLSLALRGENPIHGAATFDFTTPASGKVELGIFDITGRRVSQLVSREMDAGEHTATWQPKGKTPPGIYFAKIRAAHDEEKVRLVVIE